MKRILGMFVTLAIGCLAAAPAAAIPCGCSAIWQTTPATWGYGATCSAANSNLIANAQALADSLCEYGACAFGALTITGGCHTSTMPGHCGEIQQDGTIQYRCRVCPEIEGGGGGGPRSQ